MQMKDKKTYIMLIFQVFLAVVWEWNVAWDKDNFHMWGEEDVADLCVISVLSEDYQDKYVWYWGLGLVISLSTFPMSNIFL
jgi:hypothetical protein